MVRRVAPGRRDVVDLADALVGDFDLVDLLTDLVRRCVDVLGASAAGVMVANTAGELHAVASSSEAMRTLELFEIQAHEGPCLDCFVTGRPIALEDLAGAVERWPQFGPRALEQGFSAVQALPLRLRDTTIGALNLFHAGDSVMSPNDVDIVQTVANFVTIAIAWMRRGLVCRSERAARRVDEDGDCPRSAGSAVGWCEPCDRLDRCAGEAADAQRDEQGEGAPDEDPDRGALLGSAAETSAGGAEDDETDNGERHRQRDAHRW